MVLVTAWKNGASRYRHKHSSALRINLLIAAASPLKMRGFRTVNGIRLICRRAWRRGHRRYG